MTTTRGFIERLEVGRGGLVRARLINASGRTVFTVSDLDGDPERFNERLTKVSILRDAMNRAEPVEVEHEGGGDGDEEIERVARLSRDQLFDEGVAAVIAGLVLSVVVESRNDVDSWEETHDTAQVQLVGMDGEIHVARLDLQAPERLVAVEQLRMLRDAQASGTPVRLIVIRQDGEEGEGAPHVISVGAGLPVQDGDDRQHVVSGFVESVGTMLPMPATTAGGSLAFTRITTGPELMGDGGSVSPDPFTPEALGFFVARGSVAYALLEAAVRENVRIRARYLALRGAEERDEVSFADEREVRGRTPGDGGSVTDETGDEGDVAVEGLLLAVELQAPLASASRPVWVHIDREMLDVGPATDCVPGTPSTSLRLRSLRDLRIPYPAEWIGHACFNHGVYRFHLMAPPGSTMLVDGEPICLFTAGDGSDAVDGYSCLVGDHVVTVQIPEYVCETIFDLDVFRVR